MFQKREISRGDSMLITRYYVLPWWDRKDDSKSRFSARLHHLHSSDPGALHDHPWGFVSFIIKGSYVETTPEGTFLRKRWSVIRHKATDLHRLTIPGSPNGQTWSLVFFGRRTREWGFLTDDGWVPWYQYDDRLT